MFRRHGLDISRHWINTPAMAENPVLPPDSTGTRRAVDDLWRMAHMPHSALTRLHLSGDTPLLPSSFQVAIAAQGTIACAGLAATEIAIARGAAAQQVTVDMNDAERECTGYFTLDGAEPSVWAPLSGLYPCADGYVRIHANFIHHRDGVLRLLGVRGDPDRATRDDVTTALGQWKAVDFESQAADAGMVVAAVRSFATWDAHPQAAEIARLPLFSLRRIGPADPPVLPPLQRSHAPLTGIKVLDLTRILAGPVCGRTLAAHGATVMLINSPQLPNIESIADTSRGKLSALLDLTTVADRAGLHELLRDTRIFVQGYRPGGLARLGFGPGELAVLRPGIIYVSLTAYGPTGPWTNRRGFDSLVQSAAGFNDAEALAAGSDSPRPMPVQILDYASGFLMAFAAEVALYRQLHEGGSWLVEVSLAQTAHWLRRLGRIPVHFPARQLPLADFARPYPSGFGELVAMPHAARLSGSPTAWHYPSSPPGSHAAIWPATTASGF